MVRYRLGKQFYGIHVRFCYANDNEVLERHSNSCFVHFVSRQACKGTTKILFNVPIQYTDYNEEHIQRWITEMNKFGFPFYLRDKDKDDYIFEVKFSDYSKKIEVFLALNLIRYLFEGEKTIVPELYFNYIDEGKSPIEAMQLAHKVDRDYMPSGHAIMRFYKNIHEFIDEKTFKNNLSLCEIPPLGYGCESLHNLFIKQK